MLQKLFAKISGFTPSLIKNYHLIILINLLLAGITGYFGAKLRINSNLDRLLPETTQSVKTLRKIQEKVGSTSNLIVVLEAENFETNLAFAEKLVPKFEADTSIARVDFRRNVNFLEKNQLLYLSFEDLEKLHDKVKEKISQEKEKANPMFVDLDLGLDDEEESPDSSLAEIDRKFKTPDEFYRSEDGKILLIQLYPKERSTDTKKAEAVVSHVQEIVQSENPEQAKVKIFYGGDFQNKIDNYKVVTHDVLGTTPYGLLAVMLTILIYFWQKLNFSSVSKLLISFFKQFFSVFLIMIPLFISICWVFGLTYFVIGSLNIITGFLIVILFGLGIDFGIHHYTRYVEERTNGKTQEEAIRTLIANTGVASTTSALTTVAAFYSLILNDFKGFSEFGFIAGTGVLFSLAAMLFLLPAFIVAGEKIGFLVTQSAFVKGYESLSNKPVTWWKPALLVFSLLTVFSFAAASKLEFEYDFTNLRAIVELSKEGKEKISQVFKDSSENSPVFVLANQDEMREIKKIIEEKIKSDTLTPTIKKIKTIEKALPSNQEEKLEIIRKIRKLTEDEGTKLLKGEDKDRLERLKKAVEVDKPFTLEEVPFELKSAFVGKDKSTGEFAYIFPGVPMKDGKNAINFADDIREIKIANGKTFYTSGNPIIFADLLLLMEKDVAFAVVLTFLLVFGLLFFDFRSLKETVIALIPLVTGISWLFGAMWIFDWKLNFYNMIAIPSLIGMGIDNGVHLYLRYREEGYTSLQKVLHSTGRAMTATSITTAFGFASLTLAHHKGLNSLGYLAVTGMLSCLVTSVCFLPAILQFLENKKLIKPKK
ncbi:MMPL family transporter [bacterium]|nr:MMPL family transporter [bacterium]